MKNVLFGCILIAAAASWQACNSNAARYVNPNTGEALNLVKDEQTGLMVDAETKKPVDLYVDTKTRDTIYGKTGEVINGKLYRSKSGDGVVYSYRADDNHAAKAGGSSVTSGSYPTGEYKIKRENGETKIKIGDHYKKEIEKDGDITIKDGNKKIKIDGKTGERKVKYDD